MQVENSLADIPYAAAVGVDAALQPQPLMVLQPEILPVYALACKLKVLAAQIADLVAVALRPNEDIAHFFEVGKHGSN